MQAKHANISVFIPHLGCPNDCSFCNQHTISRTEKAPSPQEVDELLKTAADRIADGDNTEIAFFGGSFTAIPRDYMTSLLEMAHKYIKSGHFHGIRISTRPDRIDGEILTLLKNYGVTAIELGAQSMRDDVLTANKRGHSADDVRRASKLIKAHGFELGLQMMTGLYKSAPDDEYYTAEEIVKLRPDTVRIYPTVILKGTHLAKLFESGEYKTYPFEECVKLCAELMMRFTEENIRVIRLGLHAEQGVEENAVGGYYHPALGEIVRSEWVRMLIEKELEASEKADCEAPKRLMSILSGHKRSNRIYFESKPVTFRENNGLDKNMININGRGYILQ